jgi:hypothetical protein
MDAPPKSRIGSGFVVLVSVGVTAALLPMHLRSKDKASVFYWVRTDLYLAILACKLLVAHRFFRRLPRSHTLAVAVAALGLSNAVAALLHSVLRPTTTWRKQRAADAAIVAALEARGDVEETTFGYDEWKGLGDVDADTVVRTADGASYRPIVREQWVAANAAFVGLATLELVLALVRAKGALVSDASRVLSVFTTGA